MEAYISLGADIMEFKYQNTLEVLSPEDIAWADSCLANDFGISGNALGSWSDLTNALNETTISKPNPPPSRWENISSEGTAFSTSGYKDTVNVSWPSASENMDAALNGVFTSNLESATLGFGDISSVAQDLSISQNMDTSVVNGISNSIPKTAPSGWGDVSSVVRELSNSQKMDGIYSGYKVITEEADLIPGSRFNLKNVFQPTYSEDPGKRGITSYNYEQSEALGHQQEESFEDIFKVWNLETQVEDDVIVKQFNKAFSESIGGVSSAYDLEGGSLDGVIRSMGDLSLNRVA